MRVRRVVAAVAVVGAAALVVLPPAPAVVTAAGGVPQFAVDASWPPKLPNGWVFGDASSIAVDRVDHVFVLSRPRTVAAENKDHAAPPVVEFDAQGKFVRGWGGPASGFDWPDTEHGIYIDYKDNVWIGGNNPIAQLRLTQRSDDMLLKFSKRGAFVKQIGGRDRSGGNKDSANPKEPADVFVYQKTNEAFVADGYGNRRVQVFNIDGKYVDQVFINRGGPSANSAAGIGFSPDREQEFMYVADFGNGHVVIVRRKTLEVVGSFGEQGAQPGQFQNIHHLAVDSKGNIYTAEVAPGRRFQRFVFKGKS